MDNIRQIVIGALAGLALGVAVSVVNGGISRRAIDKGSSNAMLVALVCRMALDLGVLLGVYLLRNVIPLPFEPTLIGAALGLSLGGIATAVTLNRRINREKKDEE